MIAYLAMIAAGSLVSVYLGIQAVSRQWASIESLTASNLRLKGERLRADLEQQVWSAAEECLRDSDLLAGAVIPDGTLTATRQTRLKLASLHKRYPAVQRYFVVADGELVFPVVHGPLAWPSEMLRILGHRWSPFSSAEGREIRDLDVRGALEAYLALAQQPWPGAAKAHVLAAAARCYRKLGAHADAERMRQDLTARFGEELDMHGRPWPIVVALDRDGAPALARDLVQDLARGRWEISATNAECFLQAIPDPPVAARGLLYAGQCHEKLGRQAEAERLYRTITTRYGAVHSVSQAPVLPTLAGRWGHSRKIADLGRRQ